MAIPSLEAQPGRGAAGFLCVFLWGCCDGHTGWGVTQRRNPRRRWRAVRRGVPCDGQDGLKETLALRQGLVRGHHRSNRACRWRSSVALHGDLHGKLHRLGRTTRRLQHSKQRKTIGNWAQTPQDDRAIQSGESARPLPNNLIRDKRPASRQRGGTQPQMIAKNSTQVDERRFQPFPVSISEPMPRRDAGRAEPGGSCITPPSWQMRRQRGLGGKMRGRGSRKGLEMFFPSVRS